MTRYGWDVFGSRTGVVDPNGGVWESEYDRAGRVTAEVAPDYTRPVDGVTLSGAATSYGYDRVGNLTRVEDPEGNQTIYTYDDFDRVVSRVDPKLRTENKAGVWGYGYDDAGRLTQQVDPMGARVLATYDELDNQTSVSEVVRRDGAGVSDQGNPSLGIIENRHGVGVRTGGW